MKAQQSGNAAEPGAGSRREEAGAQPLRTDMNQLEPTRSKVVEDYSQ